MIMHPSQVQYLGLPDGHHTRTLNCCGVASIPVVIFGGHQIWQIIFTHKCVSFFFGFVVFCTSITFSVHLLTVGLHSMYMYMYGYSTESLNTQMLFVHAYI